MDPKIRSDWVSRRASMTLETLVSGGFCAPALLELRLKEEQSPAYLRVPPAPLLGIARLQRVLQRLLWRRHGPSHATEPALPGLAPHADLSLISEKGCHGI